MNVEQLLEANLRLMEQLLVGKMMNHDEISQVCMVFNHILRQHRHGDEALHVLELVGKPRSTRGSEESMTGNISSIQEIR